MITSLKLENFRIFTELEIKPLQRINLFAGANNTGKTGILEALYLLFSGSSTLAQLPSTFRSSISQYPNQSSTDDFEMFWQSLFYDKQIQVPPVICAQTQVADRYRICRIERGQSGQLRLVYVSSEGPPQSQLNPSSIRGATIVDLSSSGNVTPVQNQFAAKLIVISTRMEHPIRDAELYNQVTLLDGGEEKLLRLLQEIDPRLQKLRYLKAPGTNQPLVYAYFGLKNALSINQTGQGFSKLFSLFCQMLVSKAEVLLVDEIENGLYYETLPQIWKGIAALAASENIQVFATTHSRECLLAAHETMKTQPEYGFALHRLQRVKGKLEAVTHDESMLEASFKTGLEVR